MHSCLSNLCPCTPLQLMTANLAFAVYVSMPSCCMSWLMIYVWYILCSCNGAVPECCELLAGSPALLAASPQTHPQSAVHCTPASSLKCCRTAVMCHGAERQCTVLDLVRATATDVLNRKAAICQILYALQYALCTDTHSLTANLRSL